MAERTQFLTRVGYGDTDQGGIVHHAVYPRWFEHARVEFLRERGLSYAALEHVERIALPVVEMNLRYRRPARFDDLLLIETWVGLAKAASMRFDYRIIRREAADLGPNNGAASGAEDELLVEGSTVLACVRLPEMRATRIPAHLVKACTEA